MGRQRTGEAGQQRTEHKGLEFHLGGVDADAGGGQLVVADRRHRPAQAQLLQPGAEPADQRQQYQGETGIAGGRGERLGDAEDAQGTAGEGQIERDHPQDLHQSDRGDRQIDAPQPQHRATDRQRQQACQQTRQGHFQQQSRQR